jgi:hypothetical protein
VSYERGALITMKEESGECAQASTSLCYIYTEGITTIRKVYSEESIPIS